MMLATGRCGKGNAAFVSQSSSLQSEGYKRLKDLVPTEELYKILHGFSAITNLSLMHGHWVTGASLGRYT